MTQSPEEKWSENGKLAFPVCSDCGKRHYRKAGTPCVNKPKRVNGFKRNSGCFICKECGKRTRNIGHNDNYCPKCQDRLEHENTHTDNDFPNDDCGDPNCPVKHYTPEQKWWLK